MLCSGWWLGTVGIDGRVLRRRTFDLLFVLRKAEFGEPGVDIVLVPV